MTGLLFAHGFRAFFAAAGVSGLLLVPLWVAGWSGQLRLGTNWPPAAWHGHEMLFGFVSAAIAGFLLTAVPSWTRHRGFGGAPLRLMVGVWLLGRLLVASSASWPFAVVALADLAFLPVLAAFLAPTLLRERNRNTPLLLVLLALWSCDLAFHVGLHREDGEWTEQALRVGIDIVLVLVTIVGGRILPALTTSALRRRGIGRVARGGGALTSVTVSLMTAVAVIDLIRPASVFAGAVALAAAVAQALRLARWQVIHALRDPLAGVLHLAYAWLPLGLALKALALLDGATLGNHWLHALTIGVIATLIVGVMTRVALDRTGRPLQANAQTVLACRLLSAATLVRVFAAALFGGDYATWIGLCAVLWASAFGLFLWACLPTLVARHRDGTPG